MSQHVAVHMRDRVMEVELARPERKNALTFDMYEAMSGALAAADADPAVRAVLVRGARDCFTAGNDLKDFLERPPHGEDSPAFRFIRMLPEFSKPLIAAVNGPAIAGGCGIATLCDFTLAAPEAKFGYSEVRIGFIPALVSVFLIRQIGEKRARDLLLTGRIVDAGEARELGLVTTVVAADKLMDNARELAAALLSASPTSVLGTKKLLTEFAAAEVDAELERAVMENADIRATPDFREGLAAFLEKRKPVWRGPE